MLNGLVLLMTVGVIASAAHSMIPLAQQAAHDAQSAASFRSAHLREDVAGPVNLLFFLLTLAISLRMTDSKPPHFENRTAPATIIRD